MIQINPLQSYIDGGARAAITTPPSASLVFDLPGKAIWVKGVKLKGTDHTYTFSHDNYITLTNTPGSNESEDIKIGVNITTLKAAIDTTYTTGTLAQLTAGTNTTALVWTAKILAQYVTGVLPVTKKMKVNGTDYAIFTTESSLPSFFAPATLGTAGQILSCNANGLVWVNQTVNTDYQVTQSSIASNADYRVILKRTANDTAETTYVNFATTLTYNPSTKILKVNGNRVVTFADLYVGATSSAAGTEGLVPAASSAQRTYFLRGDGTWQVPTNDNTWRPIQVGGSEKLGSATNTGALNFVAGTGIEVAWDTTNKRVVITNTAPDVNHNTHYTTSLYIGANNDTKANAAVGNPYLKLFDDNTRRSTLRFIAGNGITIASDANGNITVTNSKPDVNHNTNTWRPIKVGGSEKLGSGIDTGAVDFVAGAGIQLAWDATNKKITIINSAPDVNHNTDRTGLKKGTAGSTATTGLVIANSASGLIMEGGTHKFKVGDGTNSFEIPITVTNLSLTAISALSSFIHASDLIYAAKGGGNTVTDKPSGVDAFGVISMKTADGWYGQLLMSSNTASGVYWRTATSLSGGWKLLADSGNISNKDATIGTSSTTIATIAGVNITAKIGSYSLSDHTHKVKINGSEKTIAAPGGTAVDLGSYLPLAGGTMDSGAMIIWKDWGQWGASSPTYPKANGGLQWSGTSDNLKLFAEETASDDLRLILQCGDDASPQFNIRNYLGTTTVSLHSNGTITGTSIVNSGSNNNYVLLGGGGTKLISDFATSGHTHSLSIAATSDASSIALAASTKYKLTAGGSTYVFTSTPDLNVQQVDNNNNENVPILLKNGTGTGTIISSVRTVDGVTINPSVNSLSVGGNLNVGGRASFGSSVQSNYITFHGLTSDGGDSYDAGHTYIGNRLYQGTSTTSTEHANDFAELVLFQGNDPGGGNALSPVAPGPDRIRHIAAAHLFQVYTSALSGTFEAVCGNANLVSVFAINSNHVVTPFFYKSTIATGTAPIQVTSTTVCTNLNADMLDGYHANNLYTSIGDWISKVGNTITVTVGGDANTYYPVVIGATSDKSSPNIISIWKNLGSSTASYSGNHSNGTSSMWLMFEGRSCIWDGNGGYFRTLYKSEPYATLISEATTVYSSVSVLCIYLRGGGTTYNISTTYPTSANVYYSRTNLYPNDTYPAIVEPRTTLGNRGIINGYFYGSISGNADTLDGYHASGLFTTFGNSGNNITATIGGTTKTFTVNYASNADSLTNPGKYYWANLPMQTSESTTTVPTFSWATFSRVSDHGVRAGTFRGLAVGSQSGQYIHMYERVHIGSPNGWGSRNAPSYGLSTYGGAWLATDTGSVGIGTTSPAHKLHVVGDVNINNNYFFRINSDIPETSANLASYATAQSITFYRNGLLIPYTTANPNDGGIIRCKGDESTCIFEIGTWDDSGAGETIQFNYYPTTSTVTPTYSVIVPKASGTIALTSQIPTVNNASLTLQTAGTTQTTFYANDSTNRIFNVTCANIGAAPSSHTHDHIEGPDWRSTSHTPLDYMSTYHKGSLTCEFSSTSVLPIAAASNGYSALVTITPWGDSSGGLPAQIACGNNGWYFRCASSTTAWGGFNVYWNSSGDVYARHFYETSDVRLKHDISMLSKSIRKFKFNNDDRPYYGFIAQELETLHPELVDNSGEYKKVNYNSAICYYIAELENKVQKLEDEINKLKNK